jgi:hypothetical protein
MSASACPLLSWSWNLGNSVPGVPISSIGFHLFRERARYVRRQPCHNGGRACSTVLIYHSENHLGPFDGKLIGSLNEILTASNRNNEKANITGVLIFDRVWFMQILEGDREGVSRTLARLMADDRHDAVTLMDAQPIARRIFANWWMGAAGLGNGDQAVLARCGLGPKFDPRIMTGERAVALAVALSERGLERRLAAPAA